MDVMKKAVESTIDEVDPLFALHIYADKMIESGDPEYLDELDDMLDAAIAEGVLGEKEANTIREHALYCFAIRKWGEKGLEIITGDGEQLERLLKEGKWRPCLNLVRTIEEKIVEHTLEKGCIKIIENR